MHSMGAASIVKCKATCAHVYTAVPYRHLFGLTRRELKQSGRSGGLLARIEHELLPSPLMKPAAAPLDVLVCIVQYQFGSVGVH